MAELHVESAKEAARIALRFAQAGSFMKADWQNDQPWAHRSDLAHALDHIETLAAMVLNLADRVPAGVAPAAPVAYGTIAERAAAGKDAGWWDTSGVTPSDDAKALSDAVNEIDRLNRLLEAIGDYAHDHSTGPAVPDALWEVRRMAYEGETTAGVRDTGEGPPHG